jgi:integrase
MTTAAPSTALVTIQPAFTDAERFALAGFLAGLGPPTEHALVSLLALNGLRVSEATGADIEHLGVERGHRTVTIARRACCRIG